MSYVCVYISDFYVYLNKSERPANKKLGAAAAAASTAANAHTD